MYMFIIITCGSVCDRLGSPSDFVKSWGVGGVTVACVLSACSVLLGTVLLLSVSLVVRALFIALCLQVHTKSGKT